MKASAMAEYAAASATEDQDDVIEVQGTMALCIERKSNSHLNKTRSLSEVSALMFTSCELVTCLQTGGQEEADSIKTGGRVRVRDDITGPN